jgi:hypothetical protein
MSRRYIKGRLTLIVVLTETHTEDQLLISYIQPTLH